MPDIIIRGVEIPQSCAKCPFEVFGDCYGGKVKRIMDVDDYTNARAPQCPIHELPPHGDLIDRDAFREENEYYLHREFINPKYEDTLEDLLNDAPVVVPADKEETE